MNFNSEPSSDFKYILSIDIGIKHLALVLLQVNKDYTLDDIVWFELIDITTFYHLDIKSRTECKLYHTRTISDWLAHIFYLHKELFDLVDHILIERQPIQGQVSIEQLFFFNFRHKAILIHPRSVHTFFNFGKIEYESRKQKSVEIFKYRLYKSERHYLVDEFNKLKRQHDVSDAFIQAVYFLHNKEIEYRLSVSHCEEHFLDVFRFVPYN